jgi:hypothetical protein
LAAFPVILLIDNLSLISEQINFSLSKLQIHGYIDSGSGQTNQTIELIQLMSSIRAKISI